MVNMVVNYTHKDEAVRNDVYQSAALLMSLIPLFGDETIWYIQFESIFKELARHFVDSTDTKEKD